MNKKNYLIKFTLLLGMPLMILSCSNELEEDNANSILKTNNKVSTLSARQSILMGESLDVLPKVPITKGGFYIISKHSLRALTKVDLGQQIQQMDHTFLNNVYTQPSSDCDISISYDGTITEGGISHVVYKIQWGNNNTISNSFWDVKNSSSSNETPIITSQRSNSDSQRFILEPTGDADRSVYIRNIATGKHVQIRGNEVDNVKNGALLELNIPNKSGINNDSQKFLLLSQASSDMYLTHNGEAAVKINGKIWMRNVLGDNRINPEIGPFEYNYYQFGNPNAVANANNMPSSLPNWDLDMFQPANVWNLGTESNPIKNYQKDPCPRGYRVPTATEYQALIDATTQSSIYDYSGSTASLLTSKKDNPVKLIFPGKGFYAPSGMLISENAGNFFLTSSNKMIGFTNYSGLVNMNNINQYGACIRCIAEY